MGFNVRKVNPPLFNSLLSIWGLCDDAEEQTNEMDCEYQLKQQNLDFFPQMHRD